MIQFIPNDQYPIGHVWWVNSWVETVGAIKTAWVPSVIGSGLIDAYGMNAWINNEDDLDTFCNILITWQNVGYPTKPSGDI